MSTEPYPPCGTKDKRARLFASQSAKNLPRKKYARSLAPSLKLHPSTTNARRATPNAQHQKPTKKTLQPRLRFSPGQPDIATGTKSIGDSLMYEAYWGLSEPPFSLTPDPRFLYLSRSHEDALMMLHYSILRNKGAAML